jgi:mannose/fructose-specific phosphotransferase system component IIA
MSNAGVVIVTHGNAAASMVEAAERVVGKLDVLTIAVRVGEPRAETESHIEAAVDELHTDEVLFLTDLEGSTPYNLCCRKCGGRSVVLSGMNLPMLFKLATADRKHGALSLAEELKATGLKSIHIRSAGGQK